MRTTLAVLLLSTFALFGAPTLSTDGANALPDDGLGKKVFAYAGSSWEVWFEDLIDQGDKDFNDGGYRVDFALNVVSNHLLGTVTYIGGLSAHANTLTLPGNVSFGAPSYFAQFSAKKNNEVKIQFNDLTSGATWFSGPPGYNDDHWAHALVHRLADQQPPTETPEPSTMVLLSSALGFAGAAKLLKRRTTANPVANS